MDPTRSIARDDARPAAKIQLGDTATEVLLAAALLLAVVVIALMYLDPARLRRIRRWFRRKWAGTTR